MLWHSNVTMFLFWDYRNDFIWFKVQNNPFYPLFHLAQFILSGSLLKPPLSPAFPLNLLMETPSPPPAAVEVQRNKSNLEVYLYIYKRKKEKWIKQISSFVIGNIGNNIRVYKRTKVPAGCLCLGNTPVIPLNLVSDLNQCFFHESYRCYHENMFSLCLKMTHMLTLDTEEHKGSSLLRETQKSRTQAALSSVSHHVHEERKSP